TLSCNGEILGTSKLVAAASLSLSREMYMKARIHDTLSSKPVKRTITILIILVVLYLALVVVYRVRRIRYRMAIKAAEREEREALRRSSSQIERRMERNIARDEERSAPRRAVSPEAVKGLDNIDFFNEDVEAEAPPARRPEPEPITEEPPVMPVRPVDTTGANAPRQTPPGFFEASEEPVSPEEKDYFEEFFRKK
ncbi:MAG: hypothetical protein MJ067_04980, partial [Oscillospiraceae bacterium]|nr:hypothetical protein [Oscillospiraceae bacterium]